MYSNFTRSRKQLLLKFSIVIAFITSVFIGFAQSTLPSFVDINTPGVVDYIIPPDIINMYITISGAQGGFVQSTCSYKGGQGLLIRFQLPVSYCSTTRILPGGTLRLITGRQGTSVTGGNPEVGAAGGGGGSALLYKSPTGSDWIIIAVAGGGGGAAFVFGKLSDHCNGTDGGNANPDTNGNDGKGGFGASGGINGNGGSDNQVLAFGGGGAFSDGVTTGNQGCTGKKGFPNGGAQADCNDLFTYSGGFGFGSGGAGITGGGGGGGYSGGGGGSYGGFGGGGGGGSFFNVPWLTNRTSSDFANGNGEITILCASGTLTPPLSLTSSILPELQVTGCNVNNSTGFGFSTSGTSVSLAQFNAAGDTIVAGGCNIQSIIYIDTLDAADPIHKVNRTYRVTDDGGNIAIAKQVITVVRPTTNATISPTSQTNCISTPLSTITVNASNQFGITIQWYQGDNAIFSQATIINGAISGSYTPPTTGIAGLTYYFARITDGCGGAINKVATVNVISQPITWYKDADNDGYSDPTYVGSPTCIKPGANFKSGTLGNDCNDNDATITPLTVWVLDADGDGYYSGAPFTGCLPNGATGYVKKTTQQPGDCNDNNNQVHPGALEICDGIDNDCDGLTDVFCCPPSGIVYVKANATGGNNGIDWANAYKYLADALEAAKRCNTITQIWVASGTYYPDEGILTVTNDRASTFSGRNHLSIYGGFAGTETLLSQRKLGTNNTSYMNGDISQDGIAYHYSYNVVRLDAIDSTSILDGFTIINGTSAALVGPVYQSFGGGIIVLSGNPTIQNCYIVNNNSANGGGIANMGGSAHFYNCVVANNTASGGDGGAVYNVNSEPWFVHCSIANNNVGVKIFNNTAGSSPTILNSIIRGAAPALVGSGIPTVGWSIIQDTAAWPGLGNSNADPLFLNEAAGNLRLTPCSPAINSGVSLTISPTTDITGNPRIINGTPDMGAYERTSVQVLYVDSSANGNGDGSSWANAYTSLKNALSLGCSNFTQIWVAKGTYKPTTNTDRTASFNMRNHLAIYGGFSGTETLVTQRNWNNNHTILSGDIGTLNNNSDNTYTIIANSGIDSTAVLDGFTITGGNSNANGGAMVNNAAAPTIQNCILSNNTAVSFGGAVYNTISNPHFTNCLFTGNSATNGGGVFNTSSSPAFVNCTMSANASPSGSFAWSQTNSLSNLTNCILWGNTGSASLVNTVTSPYTVNYTLSQEIVTGTGNLNVNPQFINSSTGNFGLLSCSPAINVGFNGALPSGVTKDLAGGTRIVLTNIDMGSYERQTIDQDIIIYVDAAATGNGEGSSWANACTSLTTALNNIKLCNPATTIQIAVGTYNVPLGTPYSFDKLNAIVLGGYPHGGGTRNATANPVILKGDVQVLKSLQIDGVQVQKP